MFTSKLLPCAVQTVKKQNYHCWCAQTRQWRERRENTAGHLNTSPAPPEAGLKMFPWLTVSSGLSVRVSASNPFIEVTGDYRWKKGGHNAEMLIWFDGDRLHRNSFSHHHHHHTTTSPFLISVCAEATCFVSQPQNNN